MNLWVVVLFGIGILAAMLGVLFLILLVIVKIRVHAVYMQEDDAAIKPDEVVAEVTATELTEVEEENHTKANENEDA